MGLQPAIMSTVFNIVHSNYNLRNEKFKSKNIAITKYGPGTISHIMSNIEKLLPNDH